MLITRTGGICDSCFNQNHQIVLLHTCLICLREVSGKSKNQIITFICNMLGLTTQQKYVFDKAPIKSHMRVLFRPIWPCHLELQFKILHAVGSCSIWSDYLSVLWIHQLVCLLLKFTYSQRQYKRSFTLSFQLIAFARLDILPPV